MLRVELRRPPLRAHAATTTGPDSELRAGLISTQLLGIALSRYVLQLLPVATLEAETLIELLTPVLSQFLIGPVRAVPAST